MAKDLSFNEIKGNIRSKKFMPVYLFQGEESYYIDQLTNMLADEVLDESERDFNQTIVYGLETDVATIINACRRYPMMAERQLVVVKEAQLLKNIDELTHYVKNPLHSTVLVINYKYGKLDGRKKLTGEIAKTGVVFESKKLYDNKIPDFIINYLQDKKMDIQWQTAQILTDYLGNDLSKIANELDKLSIALPAGRKLVTPALVEQNIGVSKEFNNYELQKAIAVGDVLKANRIARYFEENQKNNPVIPTLNVLFTFFSNLMICQYEKDKSKGRLMDVLGLKWDMQIADYLEAMRHYSARKTMENISLIREYDARAKGFQNSSVSPGQLLIELLYKLMHG
ncbi:MAG: DNA polymerase III subunit delta [Dysgonamonadaceae bacterium]|jgi:DNA polymerase-3 subunit delta|nr:DNA polymerase III subunit delta [Dysgonamonadaceae bacterium]